MEKGKYTKKAIFIIVITLNKVALSTIVFLLILLPSVLASEIDLTLSTTNLVAYTGETQSIDITIQNNQDKQDTFLVSIWPPQLMGVTTSLEKYLITVDANSNQTAKIYFTASLEAEELIPTFNIKAKSVTNENITDDETLYLRIVRKTPVFIKDVRLEKYNIDPEETANIVINIINVANIQSGKYYLETALKKGKSFIKTWDDTIDSIGAKSTLEVTKSYKFGKYAEPGTYTVEVMLKDDTNKVVSLKSANFNINAIYKLPTEYTDKQRTYTFLFVTTTITVENGGNVATPEFYITESLPKFAKTLFVPDIEPTIENVTENRIIYSWYVPTLEPGQKITLTYRLDLWRIWLTIAVVATIVYFAYKLVYTPRIVKGHRHEGVITRGKEILILLNIKNKARHEIKDVEIKDFVPSIARIVEKFDTLKPTIKSVEGGTELKWKFDLLKPKEERVLTYRIKPVVEIIGTMNLPKAEMQYTDMKKLKRTLASKSVLIKSE